MCHRGKRSRSSRPGTKAWAGLMCLGLLMMLGGACAQEMENGGPKEIVLGIDLGTSTSAAAHMVNGQATIIPNDQGNRVTPSYVSWSSTGERMIGDAAKNQATMNPENTIFDIKRLIGRAFSDKTVQADSKILPYKIVNQDNKPYVEVNVGNGEVKRFAPEEISAMILQRLKNTAEAQEGGVVKKAVITVPAYFTNEQRQATKDAGAIAGLQVDRIITEPTAAALAYGIQHQKPGEEEKTILVYDLGGGTFDVTLMTLSDGVFEVESTSGDNHLGGEDFDNRLMRYLAKKFEKKHGKSILNDKIAMQKLRKEVERAKRALSAQHQVRMEIESLIDGMDFSETLTRARFEEINMDLFKKTLKPVEIVLQEAKMKKADVDEIVLVGGSTRIPKVRALLSEFFNKEVNLALNPDEAVAMGAAIQADAVYGGYKRDKDNIPPIILNKTPLSLGIETVGGVQTTIIPKNTNFPTTKSQVFSTYQDNQNAVRIAVYEGERAMAKDNTLLGTFELTGIPPAPRGVPQIEVTFEIDHNSLLHVTAKDKGTNKAESINIASETGRMSEAEIQRKIKEAEMFKEQDDLLKSRINARNALEGYAFNMRNSLENAKSQLDEQQVQSIEDAISEALDWLDENQHADLDEYKAKQSELENLINPILRDLYSSGVTDDFQDDFNDDDEDNFNFDDHDEL